MKLSQFKIYFKQFDWILFAMTLLLVFFGLTAIYSVGLSQETQNFLNFKKQIIWFVLGLVLFFSLTLVDYKLFSSYSRFLYFIIFLLLVAVLIFGKTIRGTTGWFSLSGFAFQPVELAKLVLVIYLARFFSFRAREIDRWQSVVFSGLSAALFVFLVILQPDLGSAMTLMILWLGMLVVLGSKKRHLFLIFLFLAIAATTSWFLVFEDYQKDRIMTFLDPGADSLGRGYNITQSIIAIGSGEIFGRGLSLGSQSQLKFLPEAQTDFIFAVMAEELGLAGVSLILGFMAILFIRIMKIAKSAKDDFGLFLALGVLIVLFGQIFINIGMNIGLMPVTGVSLPLVSYGGSSLVTSFMMMGILESVAIRSKRVGLTST